MAWITSPSRKRSPSRQNSVSTRVYTPTGNRSSLRIRQPFELKSTIRPLRVEPTLTRKIVAVVSTACRSLARRSRFTGTWRVGADSSSACAPLGFCSSSIISAHCRAFQSASSFALSCSRRRASSSIFICSSASARSSGSSESSASSASISVRCSNSAVSLSAAALAATTASISHITSANLLPAPRNHLHKVDAHEVLFVRPLNNAQETERDSIHLEHHLDARQGACGVPLPRTQPTSLQAQIENVAFKGQTVAHQQQF